MSQPRTTITEQDGALGILPPGTKVLAILGTSSEGTVNLPSSFSRRGDAVDGFGAGPLVELAAYHIENYGLPVLMVRTATSTPGDYIVATQDNNITGTATPSPGATPPFDDYDVFIEIIEGGTLGTAGITYRWSLDGGRTLSPITALGTATDIVIAEGNVTISLGTSTETVTGGTYAIRTSAPAPSNTDLQAALEALRASTVNWELALVANPIEEAMAASLDASMVWMRERGKNRAWMANARLQAHDESFAQYINALPGEWANTVTVYGTLCAGAKRLVSGVTGRRYRRPFCWGEGCMQAAVSEEINIANIDDGGPIPGASITDSNGNPEELNETTHPGLDDARFCVARTWEGRRGVFVNRPRIFSGEGSDFELMPHRRVFNLARTALQAYFDRRLSKPILVDEDTGRILESEAREIESGAREAMAAVLLAKPKASGVSFTLSRDDNLLSTKKLTGSGRIVPLAYPEFIDVDLAFENPVLQAVPAAA